MMIVGRAIAIVGPSDASIAGRIKPSKTASAQFEAGDLQ